MVDSTIVYPLNSHIRRRYRNKDMTELDAPEARTDSRYTIATCINNSPDADWAYILSGSADD